LDLDWRSFPLQPDLDYPNEINCDHREREREREFIGTHIKQFHAKIKLRRWDTEKNLQNLKWIRKNLKWINSFMKKKSSISK